MGGKYKNNVRFIFFSPIIVVENEKLSRMRGMLIYYFLRSVPTLFRTNLCHKISFLDFHRLARLDGFGQFPNNREHEQQSHCRKHAAVYHPNGRTEKAADNKQHTQYK